jgi:NADPH:quinone reductase-like Zn-dependent oxidoreductase
MRALYADKPGTVTSLKIENVTEPVPGPNEVLVLVEAAAINPSDAKNILGLFPETNFPCIPGRDFAGKIVDGPSEWRGCSVFGSGGGLGFQRAGSHAEYLICSTDTVVVRPDFLFPVQAAAIGVPYITAWRGLIDAARLLPGETVLILGATGSVGRAAADIAQWAGANVIGVTRKWDPQRSIGEFKFDRLIDISETNLIEQVRFFTKGRGVDVIFDGVGGSLFETSSACLGRKGRHISIASVGSPKACFNLIDFYHKEAALFGIDSLKLTGAESRASLERILHGFQCGALTPPNIITCSLEEAPAAYEEILINGTRLKQVILF